MSVDVSRAFDHVDIPLLLSLAEPLLQAESYLVLKYREAGDGCWAATAPVACWHPLAVTRSTASKPPHSADPSQSLAFPAALHPSHQVVPSLGQVKVLHRRLAAAAPDGGAAPPAFPALAQRWAASHKGKAFTDQAC